MTWLRMALSVIHPLIHPYPRRIISFLPIADQSFSCEQGLRHIHDASLVHFVESAQQLHRIDRPIAQGRSVEAHRATTWLRLFGACVFVDDGPWSAVV